MTRLHSKKALLMDLFSFPQPNVWRRSAAERLVVDNRVCFFASRALAIEIKPPYELREHTIASWQFYEARGGTTCANGLPCERFRGLPDASSA